MKPIVEKYKSILAAKPDLLLKMQKRFEFMASENPSALTNPVRSVSDFYDFCNCFLSTMPWLMLKQDETNKGWGLFRRIDQAIGYFYYVLGDLQYEPQIAQWLKEYHDCWAEYLNSPQSWSEQYYRLALSDPLFELTLGKYESPQNWHCWNDFFSRRLSSSNFLPYVADGTAFAWRNINSQSCLDSAEEIKTSDVFSIKDLLADSPYNEAFSGGAFTHITLDMYNYHHFHSPVAGKVVDIRDIDGLLTDGGEIIWDKQQNRYRYLYEENLGYQMIEKRTLIVIEQAANDKKQTMLIAIIPVGVAQVGSIVLEKEVKIGANVSKGQDLGHFLCGGSDVIILKKSRTK